MGLLHHAVGPMHDAVKARTAFTRACGLGLSSACSAEARLPVFPAEPDDHTPVGFDSKRVDAQAMIDLSQKLARQVYPDAAFASIRVELVEPDGRADLSGSSSQYLAFEFRSPAQSKKGKIGAPGDCIVEVDVRRTGVTVQKDTSATCAEKVIDRPRCTIAQLWKRLVAQGAPSTNVVANFTFWIRGGRKQWLADIPGVKKVNIPDTCL